MALRASIGVDLGALTLNADLDVGADVVCIVGPNGAGKSTIVRALAGILPLTRGRVEIDGQVVEDTAGGVRLEPEARRVGVVFQEHRLFAHLSSLENVAFGLRARRVPRAAARRTASEWLERVGVPDVPATALSGGQAQRVALARALATEPAVLLLLDEPLASVDAAARIDLRRLIRDELGRYPGSRLLITHDPIEAAALGAEILVLEDGVVVQRGALADVTARPTSAWVADMVGLNLWQGTAAGTDIVTASGARIVTADRHQGPVFAAFRPNAVTLHRSQPEGSARNVWQGVAAEVHPAGDRARVRIEGAVSLTAEVTVAAVAALDLASGGVVWASVKATDVLAYPA